jgi:outer membrane protein OmpA-like peptidoglycan-associated protein
LALLLLGLALPAQAQSGPDRSSAAVPVQVEMNAAQLAKGLNETGSVALHSITFDAGRATITRGSLPELAAIGELLKSDPALALEIQGHTDNTGQKASNVALSRARASAVRDYLIKTFSIAPIRLTASGFGDSQPVADNSTANGRAQNRRVTLVKVQAAGIKTGTSPLSATGTAPREWTGRIRAGMMAVGGETTGITIETGQERLELQPADQTMRSRLQELDGKP